MKRILLIVAMGLLCGCVNRGLLPSESKKLNVINEEVYTSDKNYDLKSNVSSKENITCEPTILSAGKNIIKCYTDDSSVSYNLYLKDTNNKNIIFFGDSITSGFGSKSRKYSWVDYLRNNYDFQNVINAGIIDYRVSTYDDSNKWLGTQVTNHYNDQISYDFVIMQGGINDVFYNTPLGKMKKSFNSDFDIYTFAGGLESFIQMVKSKWPQAKIGYIITYFTPDYTEFGKKWSTEDYQKYYDLQILILKKWEIPYLDLHSLEIDGKSLEKTLKDYLPDNLHLNDAGYDYLSPFIYDWIVTL